MEDLSSIILWDGSLNFNTNNVNGNNLILNEKGYLTGTFIKIKDINKFLFFEEMKKYFNLIKLQFVWVNYNTKNIYIFCRDLEKFRELKSIEFIDNIKQLITFCEIFNVNIKGFLYLYHNNPVIMISDFNTEDNSIFIKKFYKTYITEDLRERFFYGNIYLISSDQIYKDLITYGSQNIKATILNRIKSNFNNLLSKIMNAFQLKDYQYEELIINNVEF